MNQLKEITIKYIKGIENKRFVLDLFPNKPSILVAPNGFGKSSFACAFSSLKSTKIELDEKNFHKQDASLPPELNVKLDDTIYSATRTTNTIQNKFDYFVINSTLYAKAKKRNMGRFTTATASLEVKDIELISTIPDKILFEYNISYAKESFGKNGKLLSNINTNILNNLEFLYLFSKKIDYSEFAKARTYRNPLQQIIVRINNQEGTVSQLKEWIQREELSNLEGIEPLRQLAELIATVLDVEPIDSYC
jgi:hypothetical protein